MKNRLSEIRWRKGWSQAALARRSGVAKTTICEIENGNISNPSVEIAYKLSKALNVDVWEIFYMEQEKREERVWNTKELLSGYQKEWKKKKRRNF